VRYLPLTDNDRKEMLKSIGIVAPAELFADIPSNLVLTEPVALTPAAGEMQVERQLSELAAKNLAAGSVPFFVGAGAYRHHVPASVDHLVQRSEFLTSYTPYQPEVSQGTLQYLFEFQTQVVMLTGMEVANASMYDGSTAAAEAVLMAMRITRRNKAAISDKLHPHYRDVIANILQFSGGEQIDLTEEIDTETACVIVQYPDFYGNITDFTKLAEVAHSRGALLIVTFNEALALAALRSPGEMGADIVAGEGQSFGNSLNFGGPYLGLFATREKYLRQMPGRIAGQTADIDGRRGFVLTLSTREQHIRREKATSNICTNSGLTALAFSIHLSLLGEDGIRQLARINHAKACKLADMLTAIPGVEVLNKSFFNEFTIRTKMDAAELVGELAANKILGGVPVSRLRPEDENARDLILVTATETVNDADMQSYAKALRKILA
jgi:glycine dehydrogenase subunit 1